MRENKTKPTNASVEAFIGAIADDERRQDCLTILALMRDVTGDEPRMWGPSIIGFGDLSYRGASGESAWFKAGFSPRKRELTLYLMGGFARFDALMARLGKHKTGKSCLYIKRVRDVDLAVLRDLVEASTARAIELTTSQ
jgi:hypothetical protein